MDSYDALFAAVRGHCGLVLSVVNTGGGCYVAQVRLESGHWVVVAEADDFLSATAAERLAYEREHQRSCGWYVGVYDNEPDGGTDAPASVEGCRHQVTAPDAEFDDLPQLISETLRQWSAATRGAGRRPA